MLTATVNLALQGIGKPKKYPEEVDALSMDIQKLVIKTMAMNQDPA